MSSARLKRKLGNLGVDTSSRKANENFCLIGTPLPPLEKSKDTGEFVPLWKQEVRDEKGRRRLHGAFTGGFSAGYFNTVGSKEGWMPSTFVSSRADRAKSRVAKPEDFMDEEDLAELRADQKLVSQHDEMDILGGTQAEMARRPGGNDSQKDPISLALEQSMVPAPRDSAGARILKKMGWKLGQGIGPRVSWRQREIQHGRDPDRTGPDIDEEAKKHTYAPKDIPVPRLQRKDDVHGLGYDKAIGLNASLGVAEGEAHGTRGPRLAGGFGLGALNDADEDDLDVYDQATSHGRSISDGAHVFIGRRREKPVGSAISTQPTQESSRGVFRDGNPPIHGFRLAMKPVVADMWFPMPEVPQGWKPNPKALWEQEKATLGDKENIPRFPVPSQAQTHAQWKIGISADQRGAALGETPLPSAPRSVFEYMSKKDEERIKSIAATRSAGPQHTTDTAESAPPRTISSEQPYIPPTDPNIAQAALQGFQPFLSNPPKQSRYTAYLRAHAEPGSGVSIPGRMPNQSPEVYALEMNEFAKAASLFRPVSGAMAGRFTSAAVLELAPQVVGGLHTPTGEEVVDDASKVSEEEKKKEEVKEEDPKAHAARLGMYGAMTREVKPWQPARLLCKRFGVQDPSPDVHFDTPGESSSAAADAMPSTDVTGDASGVGTGGVVVDTQPGPSAPRGKRDLANIGLGEDDGQGQDILTYERPSMDVFKAIFASDDEDSDEEKDEKDEKDEKSPEDEPVQFTAPPQPSTSSQTMPPQTSIPNSSSGPNASDAAKQAVVADENVNLATFKPTFIPRDLDAKNGKAPARKEKKNKKSKAGPLVSFDVDEVGGDILQISARRETKDRDRPKKKRKKHREEAEDEMWVEKPPPEIVKNLPAANSPPDDLDSMKVDESVGVAGPPRGRKRAVDFM